MSRFKIDYKSLTKIYKDQNMDIDKTKNELKK